MKTYTENDRSATHCDRIEETMFAVVVRGHRREFLDVDRWERKDNLGESVYVGWTLSAESDLSWIQLEDRTDVVMDR